MSEMAKQVFRITIEASIQDVWDTLTKRDEPLPFFFGNVLDTTRLEPGAPIRMRTPNGRYTGVVGDVLEFDSPHRYSHTFKFTDLDDPPCRVTYELKEVEDGVEFTLTSDEVPVGTKTEKYMSQGGAFIGKTLKSVVERGRPSLGTRTILAFIRMSQPFAPKKCLSSNWPLEGQRIA